MTVDFKILKTNISDPVHIQLNYHSRMSEKERNVFRNAKVETIPVRELLKGALQRENQPRVMDGAQEAMDGELKNGKLLSLVSTDYKNCNNGTVWH